MKNKVMDKKWLISLLLVLLAEFIFGCGKEIKGPEDTTAPVVTLSSPTGDTITNNDQLEVSGSIDDLAISSVTFILNGWWMSVPVAEGGFSKTITLSEGTNSFQATAVDSAGNQGNSPQFTIILDTVSPSVAINLPESGAYINTDTVIVKGTMDDPSPSSEIEGGILLAGGVTAAISEQSWTITLINLDEGSITISAIAYDKAGNEGVSSPVNITVDTQSPRVSITSPAEGYTINQTTVEVKGTVSDSLPSSGLSRVVVNGQTAIGTVIWMVEVPGLFQGINTITATAVDKAGNQGSTYIEVYVDSIAPAPPVITSPPPGPTSDNTPTVSGAAEPGSVVNVFEGIIVWGATLATGGSFALTLPAVADGPHTFQVIATDGAGNTSGPSTGVTIFIDTVKPQVLISFPDSGDIFATNWVVVSGSVTDALPSSGITEVWVDGVTATITGTDWTATLEGLPEGSVTVTVRAYDGAGNEGFAAVNITIDTQVPQVSITSPAPGSTQALIVVVEGMASDALSGIALVTVNGFTADFYNGNFSYILNGLSGGPLTIIAEAADNAGNTTSDEISVIMILPIISSLNPTRGAAGTEVMISGSYFGTIQGSSTVTFNGIEAPITVWSDEVIVAQVPEGATPGPVVVKVNGVKSNGVYFLVLDIWFPIGPGGGRIFSLVVDPTDPDIVYAGTDQAGVFKSTDGGEHWQVANNGLPWDIEGGLRILGPMAIDYSNPEILYVPVYNGGVYKSFDGGESWVSKNNGLPHFLQSFVSIDPITPTIIYTSWGKSTNGGENWSPILVGGNKILINPEDTNILYTSGVGGGVYKSTDGGSNWGPKNNGLTSLDVYDVAMDPVDPDILYAAAVGGVFKTIDGAENWIQVGLTGKVVRSVAIDPADPSRIYVGTLGMYISDNAGATWTASTSGIEQVLVQRIAISPSNPNIIYAGTNGDGIFRSIDRGESWEEVNTGLFNSITNYVSIDPQNTSTIYARASKSIDAGGSWNKMPEIDPVCMAINPQDTSVLYVGAPRVYIGGGFYIGDGVYTSTDGGISWVPKNNGLDGIDIRDLRINPINTDILYAVADKEGIFTTTNGGESWLAKNNGLAGNGSYSTVSLAINPINPDIVYTGTEAVYSLECECWTPGRVYRTTDGGDSWYEVLMAQGINGVWALAVHPASPNIVYAGADVDALYKSENGGDTWSRYDDVLLNTGIRAIALDPTDTSILYIAVGTLGVSLGGKGTVVRSTDGGESWEPFGEGLLNIRFMDFAVDPQNPKVLYTASWRGSVYKRILP